MKTVTSKDNPVLKSARRLLTRKGREEGGAFLVEGRKLISEAADAGFEVERVFVNAGALVRGEAEAGVFTKETALEERLFGGLAQTVSPQPYIAVMRRPGAREKSADGATETVAAAGTAHLAGSGAEGLSGGTDGATETVAAAGPAHLAGSVAEGPGCVLVLDRVGDPGNAGTMVRTALAAGMDEVWCLKGTADIFSDKAIRASAGAVFHLPAIEGFSARGCIERARSIKARIIVCSAGGEDLYETGLCGRIAVVVGSEASGAQDELLAAADAVVGIPMTEKAESLNAAAAAAVVMYEALRQRQG